ncbi:MAG: 1-acyl-sn-glycerol-3-phosphate acyltransferase [Nitrospinae bacterium]|nr:1-acyl-sn-glycerol-3-phosphate acyltransferase [Nitrospinota bacterium]
MIDFNEEDERRFAVSRFARWFAWGSRFLAFPLVEFYFKVMHRTRVIGLENIPREGGVMICANHQAWVDTLLIPITFINRWKTTPFMAPAKEELFKVPVIRTFIRLWGAFPVKRRQRDFDAMKRIAYYANHYPVMLFPEGTRSKTGELLRGRSGVGWIVHSARPTVIPTLVINSEWYPGGKRGNKWFGVPYIVVFGKPLDVSDLTSQPESKKVSQEIADRIMAAIADLREKHQGLHLTPPQLGAPGPKSDNEAEG